MEQDTELEILRQSAALAIPANQPAMSIAEAKEFFKAVEEAVKELIPLAVCVEFKDKKGIKHYARPTAYLEKVACVMGVGVLVKPAIYVEKADGSYSYQVIAIAYRGSRGVSDMASCSSLEKDFMDETGSKDRKEHDVLTMASTRAHGRALRKFFGMTEPTAEELGTTKPPQQPTVCNCGPGLRNIDPNTKLCRKCGNPAP